MDGVGGLIGGRQAGGQAGKSAGRLRSSAGGCTRGLQGVQQAQAAAGICLAGPATQLTLTCLCACPALPLCPCCLLCPAGDNVWVKVVSKTGQRLGLAMRDVDQVTGEDLLPMQKGGGPAGLGGGSNPAGPAGGGPPSALHGLSGIKVGWEWLVGVAVVVGW